MATWRSVVEDEYYQKLPLSEKRKTKAEFFGNVIMKSPKWAGSSDDEQLRIQREFLQERPEEGMAVKPSFGNIIELAQEEFRKTPFAVIDKPVEEIAKFIEPDKAEAGAVGALKYLPRQMLAEYIRLQKPSTVGAYGALGKLAKPVLKPVAKTVSKYAGKVIPESVKKVFLKNLTVGKGQTKAYQALAEKAKLERLSGGLEAQDVANILTTKKGGKLLSPNEQKYLGKLFRKEIDVSGKKSALTMSAEKSAKIAKNIEVETAFNPKVQQLNQQLRDVNKTLRSKEVYAKSLIGKEYITDTGFVEKVAGVSKVPKKTPTGKLSKKRFDIRLESEPIAPTPPTATPIPKKFFPEEAILRETGQVSKLKTTNKFVNLSRKELLKQRKNISSNLQKELEEIHLGVRAKYDVFDKTFVDKMTSHPRYQELKSISDEGRTIMDKWSKELVASGIPKEHSVKTIETNLGEYMRRMFKTKLKSKSTGIKLFKDLRLRLSGLKHRKNLSSEVLAKMGEIKEPALPTAVAVKEISTSVANNRLFSKVAANPEWVSDFNITGKMIKMPKGPSMGALSDKWVVPEIGADINAITMVGQQAKNLYLKALSAWKYGKVVLNPAAQARNFLSNSILLDLSGTNHIRQAQLFPRVIKDYMVKGPMYQQALRDGAIGGEFVGTETMQKIQAIYLNSQKSNFQKMVSLANTPFRKAGEAYQGMEQLSKMIKYTDVIQKGGGRELATREAQKWLFDYNKVPKIIDIVKQSPIGAPFITFTYKALPRIAETLVTRPLKIYKYYSLAKSFNEMSRKYMGMSPVDFAREQDALPKWVLRDIGGFPTNLLLPWRDKHGRTQWLNLEYILPIGQAPEIAERGLAGFVSNPATNLVADIIKNIDFKGSEIIPPWADKKDAAAILSEHMYKTLAPAFAPGGTSFERLKAGLMKTPERFNEKRTKETIPAILDTVFGLKINAVDVDESNQFKLWDKGKRIEELKSSFYKIYNDHTVKQELKDEIIDKIFKKQQKILKEQ